MSYLQWNDDDQLQVALGEALQDPPHSLLEAARGSYAWRTIDAELADLSHDSIMDGELVSGSRAEVATPRYLKFETSSGDLILEFEVTPDGLIGQPWPMNRGELELQTADGEATALALGEEGDFAVHPAPSCSFRLYWRAANGREVLTVWTSL